MHALPAPACDYPRLLPEHSASPINTHCTGRWFITTCMPHLCCACVQKARAVCAAGHTAHLHCRVGLVLVLFGFAPAHGSSKQAVSIEESSGTSGGVLCSIASCMQADSGCYSLQQYIVYCILCIMYIHMVLYCDWMSRTGPAMPTAAARVGTLLGWQEVRLGAGCTQQGSVWSHVCTYLQQWCCCTGRCTCPPANTPLAGPLA
jgi:hypothetical protein